MYVADPHQKAHGGMLNSISILAALIHRNSCSSRARGVTCISGVSCRPTSLGGCVGYGSR